jgi:hypothetical protein
MAVPAVVSSQVPAGDTTKRYFDLLAQRPLRIPRLVGLGDARILATTDAVTSGSVGNLTTLFATQVAAGLVLFPAQSLTVVRLRAYGRGTAASLMQFIETAGVVMMNTGPTPVVATPAAAPLIASAGGTTATLLLAVSGNDVIVNFTGAATAYNWVIDINLEDPVGLVAGA